MKVQAKLKPQLDEFGTALTEWLSGDVTGHLGPYMYAADDSDTRWKNGHSAHTYYLGADDKATFDLMAADIDITVDNLFDLGPGGDASVLAKSLPICQATAAKTYLPVDLSPALAQAAAELAVAQIGVAGKPVIADFFRPFPFAKSNSLVALMGGTIGNFETYATPQPLQTRLAQIFAHYRAAVGGKSYFLVSFDANTDGDEIRSCYDNKEFGGLVRSCVSRAIDTGGFDYQVRWTPDNYQLATGLLSREDQMLAYGGRAFMIGQDEFLPVLNSYRFPVAFVNGAAERAGWRHRKTWSATGRVHYLLFEAI